MRISVPNLQVPIHIKTTVRMLCWDNVFLNVFWGLGPKALQGGPKDPPEHPTRSNLIENCTTNGGNKIIFL